MSTRRASARLASSRPASLPPSWPWLVLQVILLGAAAAVLGTILAFGRHHLAAKRVHTVVAGHVYRGAAQEPLPLERLIQQYGLKTIVTLLHDDPQDPQEQAELALTRRFGLEHERFPMPGTGLGDFDALDAAVEVLADQANHPVFVHCAAGVHRTGAVIAIYRMRHQGWSFADAIEEMDRRGAAFGKGPELREHMVRYHAERIAPR